MAKCLVTLFVSAAFLFAVAAGHQFNGGTAHAKAKTADKAFNAMDGYIRGRETPKPPPVKKPVKGTVAPVNTR
jgi:hypothetical protein